jgi:hypothetical protein
MGCRFLLSAICRQSLKRSDGVCLPWTFTQFGQLGAGMTESASGSGLIVADRRSSAIVTKVDGANFNDPLYGGPRARATAHSFYPRQ